MHTEEKVMVDVNRKVRRREIGRARAGIFLTRYFFVWFVHGLELLQQAGGGEDVGRS